MQPQIIRISTAIPQKIKKLYENSFPLYERRPWIQQQVLVEQNNIHLYEITMENLFAGFIFLWQLSTFIFAEHFAIDPLLRQKGTGTAVMRLLAATFTSIVLETEPAEKGLYASAGYCFMKNCVTGNFYIPTNSHPILPATHFCQ